MLDLLVLTRRHVREAARGRGARVLVLLLVLSVVLPSLLMPQSPSTALWVSFLAIAFLALAVGASAGLRLPSDRRKGRMAWLLSLASPAPLLRVAPAAAGMLLALLVAVTGTLALALVVSLRGAAPQVRHVEVVLPDGTRDRFDATYEIPLVEAARAGDVLEVALRRSDVVGLPFRVAWAAGGEAGDVRLDHVETLEVALPEGTLSVTLRNETSDAALFAIGAWRLREPGSWWVSMLLAGIALGVTAGVLAPIAVLVSRFTSAPTAVAAALVLALTGLARPWLVGLLPPGAGLKQGLALRTVEGAARLAPDVAGIRLLGEPGVGRALEWTGLGVVLPTIAYALVALLLVALPAPRGLEPEPSP